MAIVTRILEALDGKKSTILAISAVLLSYAVASGLIDANLGALLQTILSIISGGAVYATKDMSPLGANKLKLRK